MALYSSLLVAKWRNTIASETPAASAISFVVVPRKPRWENRPIATRRICRRRFSPVMRALLDAAGLLGTLSAAADSGSILLEGRAYLPPRGHFRQVASDL